MRKVRQSEKSSEQDIAQLRRTLHAVQDADYRDAEKRDEILGLLARLIELSIQALPYDKGQMTMRDVSNNEKQQKLQLKHLSRMLERARQNTSRPADLNEEVIDHLKRLVYIFTQEDLEMTVAAPTEAKSA